MRRILLVLILALAAQAQAFCIICFNRISYRVEMIDGNTFKVFASDVVLHQSCGKFYGEMPVKSYTKKGKPVPYTQDDVRGVWKISTMESGVSVGGSGERDFYPNCYKEMR